jgi:hypothetical protein
MRVVYLTQSRKDAKTQGIIIEDYCALASLREE